MVSRRIGLNYLHPPRPTLYVVARLIQYLRFLVAVSSRDFFFLIQGNVSHGKLPTIEIRNVIERRDAD